jgi:hypothetical protein
MTAHHPQVRVDSGCREISLAVFIRFSIDRILVRMILNGIRVIRSESTESAVTTPRGQPPLVTSTSARVNRSEIADHHGPGHGLVTAPVTAPVTGRVRDWSSGPAGRNMRPESGRNVRVATRLKESDGESSKTK